MLERNDQRLMCFFGHWSRFGILVVLSYLTIANGGFGILYRDLSLFFQGKFSAVEPGAGSLMEILAVLGATLIIDLLITYG